MDDIEFILTDQIAQDIVEAIVKQAADDYREAAVKFRAKPTIEDLLMMRDVEAFFLSSFFRTLTFLDGKPYLERLRDEERTRKWMCVKDKDAFFERVKAIQEKRDGHKVKGPRKKGVSK